MNPYQSPVDCESYVPDWQLLKRCLKCFGVVFLCYSPALLYFWAQFANANRGQPDSLQSQVIRFLLDWAS